MPGMEAVDVDEEANGGEEAGNLNRQRRRRRRQRRRRPSLAASSETTTDGSFRFTDSDSDQSWASVVGGPYEECRFSAAERQRHSRRKFRSVPGWVSDEEIDLESGELELKARKEEEEEEGEERRDCRICHLSLSGSGGIGGDGEPELSSGEAIELGCSCRGDLGTAHKQCAETWFKIRGNTICEICGETAVNIGREQAVTEENETSIAVPSTPAAAAVVPPETQRFWHGRRVMNFLLASMVFAFVISWLFHFNLLP
ncbi:unnamed protein product [Cuscuta epithymum]|uniref:RING-CH-type domain-containing protein n=1 Tax=Cuscuta epithymum TaxID=186058 RepID=A0AAV0DX98_9ASTE|nr:unnamed protein product [Cuscuta epithymum]